MSIVTYDDLDTPVFEIDFIRYLFANGAQGSVWGPLPYYSDAAGTVEADWGDPVGNIPDASGNEQDWTQVTSTARPILGRVPVGGRRNQLLHTEDYSQWGDSGGQSIISTGIDDPFGGSGAVRVTGVSVSGRFSIPAQIMPGTAVQSFWCRSVGPLLEHSNDRYRSVSVNQESGDYYQYQFFRDQLVPDEWVLVEIPVAFYGATDLIYIRLLDVTCDFYWPQHEAGTVKTPYQRVGNEYDITEAGVNEAHYLRFDGTDDLVTTTLPAISGGTIVLAGTNGIWIDSLDFAGGAFSVGPGTYTGGPAGLMSILGDLLVGGGFVIDRALTPKEIAQVKSYYKARGSAGLLVWSDQILLNGDFSQGQEHWIKQSFTLVEVNDGILHIINDGGASRYIFQPGVIESGAYYHVIARCRGDGTAFPRLYSDGALNKRMEVSTEWQEANEFFFGAEDHRLVLQSASNLAEGVGVFFDYVILRKLELAP